VSLALVMVAVAEKIGAEPIEAISKMKNNNQT